MIDVALPPKEGFERNGVRGKAVHKEVPNSTRRATRLVYQASNSWRIL